MVLCIFDFAVFNLELAGRILRLGNAVDTVVLLDVLFGSPAANDNSLWRFRWLKLGGRSI